MSTSAQITANQKNAQLSTGPTSSDGKAKSSLNAVKTGLTGRTVLLAGDDAAAYEAHVASFFARSQPAGDEERNLVQSLADTEWRLLRIPALEFGIYAFGRLEFGAEFPKEDAEIRKHLIEAKIFLAYQRQLNNLSIQESRLRRQREKDTAALRNLQQLRKQQQAKRLTEAARQYIAAVHEERHNEWEPDENGFEFSITEVELRALEIEPDLFAEWAEANAAENAA
ncbi:MAG TPA: hypothetical protein VMF91_01435 [Bryobacteraceae bacterium]|nr:hypothetical protein [Bryobacteraceae bacterium]